MKPKKPTLREEYEKLCIKVTEDTFKEKIWNFFEPHLKKKTPKPQIEIPENKIIIYNELFPNQKSGSGKRMRCNIKELTKAFQYFFKQYPDYTWETILQATQQYLAEQESTNYQWTMTAKYFCVKFKTPSMPSSELAEFCDSVLSGDTGVEIKQGFHPRIL